MNYETTEDKELELRLCRLLDVHNGDDSFFENKNLINCRPRFCTDWNATMPLAVEYGVGIVPAVWGNSLKNPSLWMATNCEGDFYSEDNNPLRAIVICLIKVLEAKK